MSALPSILITGANGFTGRHACRFFSMKGMLVTALVRDMKFSLSLDGEIVQGDLTDYKSIEKIIKSSTPDYILHLAGVNSVPDSWNSPYKTLMANVCGTLNLLEASRLYSPHSRIIVTGSALESALPPEKHNLHPYGVSKCFQALLSLYWQALFNQPIMIAKPCNIIGQGNSGGVVSSFAKAIAKMELNQNKAKLITVSNLQNKREFIDVRDLLTAYETIFKNGEPGISYEIGSGNMVTLNQLLNIFKSYATVEFQVFDQTQEYQIPAMMNTASLNSLGWKPSYSLNESIIDILLYHRLTIE